jgi:hypothetical protein
MTHDRRVGQEPLDVLLAEPRHLLEVETVEGAPEALPFAQDRQPGEAGLKSFEAELLEQPSVVGDREAPFRVVVGAVLGRRVSPEAADDAVLAADEPILAQGSTPFGVSQVIASIEMRPAWTDGSCSVSWRVSSRLVR